MLGQWRGDLYLRVPTTDFHYLGEKFGDFIDEGARVFMSGNGSMRLVLLTLEEQENYNFE